MAVSLVVIVVTLLVLGAVRNETTAVGVEAGAEPGPAATALDTELARRFALAQQAAAADGVPLEITSGWRSAQDQQAIVDKALARHGDPVEAHRWVLPPELSAHVQGLAIDVGGTEGASWLTDHGLEFGLCRTYANEVWHFEKLPDGATDCPEPHVDSSWGW
ncbi:MAG: D-alanyl-D-alanine carboxypeptidase family protein [Cellulomonas sp.]|nr:D-alanyl-D-alanine carboxypeptidase family protein [Cellulomonas sp.]